MTWFAVQADDFDWDSPEARTFIGRAPNALTAAEDALESWIGDGLRFDTVTLKVARLEPALVEEFKWIEVRG